MDMSEVVKHTTKKRKTASCGLQERSYCFSSPLGNIYVTACTDGLHSMGLEPNMCDENFSPNERAAVELMGEDNVKEQPQVIKECLHWLQVYFRNPKLVTTVTRPDICCFKQPDLGFRARVWQVLADTVGPGEIITYGALAEKLENPGAVRAVGSAMRNNPNGIIVPCHRVVRANDMGLYHGGQRQVVKSWLLRHEGVAKFQ